MDKQIVVFPLQWIKRKERLIHTTKWMNPQIIMLSERCQTKKNTYGRKEISGCLEWSKEDMDYQMAQEYFWG